MRTDTSVEIGSGHLMRCLALADQLRGEGAEVAFVCRDLPGGMFDLLDARGYRSARLPMAEAGKEPQQFDAEETINAAGQLFPDGVDWLVVDHYELDAAWESMLKLHVRKLMVIDDLANRLHDCDILLDQNYYEGVNTRYDDLTPKSCRKLLGPRFALLRPEFREVGRSLKTRDGNIRRVLVFFAAGDPTDETTKALNAIRVLQEPNIEVDAVVGRANPRRDQIERLCAVMPNVSFHCQAGNMAELMARADLALGAAGIATWERLALKLPAVVWTIADNQISIAESMSLQGVLVNLGPSAEVNVERIVATLRELLDAPSRVRHMSERAQCMVDGYGVTRVVNAVMGHRLRITLVSDRTSWINEHLPVLAREFRCDGHYVRLVHEISKIADGDIAFYLGCGQIVPPEVLRRNQHNLVVHESALPKGRGWSPLTWQILEGSHEIPICLFEANNAVDSGKIYIRDTIKLNGTELIREIREAQARKSFSMCERFVLEFPKILAAGRAQSGQPTYYRHRTPDDSRIDPGKTIREQFALLRVVDNERYPAFFELDGQIFILKIERKT